MRLRVNVAGGTRAGWRAPFIGKPLAWQCDCVVVVANPDVIHTANKIDLIHTVKKTQIGPLTACPDCGASRPRQ